MLRGRKNPKKFRHVEDIYACVELAAKFRSTRYGI